ncbi:MAG: PHP domain-containing protein [Clostridia bacterium]|nr:PHP domain-containing protein [Clostridia bacterium]
MTPNNIAGMAALAGLNIVALTDHNSCRNCPAFFAAAKKQGIIPVAGMELTTSEDIHIVCLFEALEDALQFDKAVDSYRIRVKNRTDIFGDQLLMDENDAVIGTEEDLLSNATQLSLDDVPALVEQFQGVCYPAHVDRESNGILATLGMFPPTPHFALAELHDMIKREVLRPMHPQLEQMLLLNGSDAHYLWDIRDKEHFLELEDEPYSSDLVRKNLFRLLRGERT